MASLINKARKPKFEVHLTIYDLNNVPLVTGVSFIKWHLPHSLSSEHRGRTPKCPIADHRVEYNYGKVIPVRIGIDKNQNLVECPIEFEIVQEFSNSGPLSAGGAAGVVGGGGTEKINLGVVRINLSEYVEESEALLRSSRRVSYTGSDLGRPLTAATSTSGYTNISTAASGHSRKRSSLSLGGESVLAKSVSSHQTSSTAGGDDSFKPLTASPTADVEEGVIRRYLMQDSKINSTLKVGVLMIQIDGERNYVAPPLKTAPVFGGIAGLMASGDAAGSLEPPADILSGSGSADAVPDPIVGKPRDLYEVQDMYRRALAASWASQPGEMPADECIEDIFSGGDGFRDDSNPRKKHQTSSQPRDGDSPSTKGGKSIKSNRPNTSSGNGNGKSPASSGSNHDEDADDLGTLRPHHLARLRQHFHRSNSNPNAPTTSSTSASTSTTQTAFPAFKDATPPNHSPADPSSSAYPHNNNAQVHFQSPHQRGQHRRDDSKEERERERERPRSRSGSMGSSLGTALGTGSSEGSGGGRGREGFKKPREVREGEVREDMVAWTMGGLAI